MSVGRICSREVDTAEPDESVRVCAQRMGTRDVGTLVVLDESRKPLGILTDRDVVVRVVGPGMDPETTRVRQVMSKQLHTCFEDAPIEDALRRMRAQSVRRLLVVERGGPLVGILALDDVLELLAEELTEVGRLIRRQSPDTLSGTA